MSARDDLARRWGKNALATLGNVVQRVTSAPFTLPPLEPADRERFMELQNQSAAVFGGAVDATKVEFSFCDTAEDAQDAANDDDLKPASQEEAASDDDVQMGSTTLATFAHARCHCSLHPFASTDHSEACDKCHCYVCDVPVSQCPKWAEHCHATDTGKDAEKWKYLRDRSKQCCFEEACQLWLQRVGFDFVKAAKTGTAARSSVGTFLNRLLGLRLSQQNAVFDVFAKLVEHAVPRRRPSFRCHRRGRHRRGASLFRDAGPQGAARGPVRRGHQGDRRPQGRDHGRDGRGRGDGGPGGFGSFMCGDRPRHHVG